MLRLKIMLFSLALILIFSISTTSSQTSYIDPHEIIPPPQQIEMLSTGGVVLDSSWEILTNLGDENDNFTAFYLKEKIKNAGVDIPVTQLPQEVENKKIIIGNPNENPTLYGLASQNGIDINSQIKGGFGQGYALLIKPEQILILSDSNAGAFYGVISLMWLLKSQGSSIILPHTRITDWPDLKIRAFYGGGAFYKTREEWIENLAKYKYNMWLGALSGIHKTSSQNHIQTQKGLENYIRKRGFFTAVTFSAITPAYRNSNLFEGVYSHNVSMKFGSDGLAASQENRGISMNNLDFEEDSNGNKVPDFWIFSSSKDEDYWSWDCVVSHSGKCSVKLYRKEPLEGVNSSSFLYSANLESTSNSYIPTIKDRVYHLSFFAKRRDLTSTGKTRSPQITVVFKDSLGKVTSKSVVIEDEDNTWREYKIVFPTNNDITSIMIYSRAQSTEGLELWLDNFKMTDLYDKLYNVIKTNDTNVHVWDAQRSREWIEGVDYQLVESGKYNYTHPEYGKKTQIKRTATSRIPAEGNILVDYDFVVNFQDSRNEYSSFSDPLTVEIFEDYKTTFENLKIDYTVFLFDEIRGMNRDSRSVKRGLENYQVLANFVNKVAEIIKKYNPESKIFAWDDMFSPFHNGMNDIYQIPYGGPAGKTWYSLDLLDRDIVPIVWWYDRDRGDYFKMSRSPEMYNFLGFDWLGGPWDNEVNIKQWSYLSYKYGALGMVDHEYYDRIGGVPIAANYSWNAIKSYEGCDPEALEICDGIDNDCDDIYWPVSYRSESWGSNIDEGFNLTKDPFNCGSCNNICYWPQSFTSCNDGQCHFDGCYNDYYDINNNLEDGCEYNCVISFNGLETCDGKDNNCDGTIDEDCPSTEDFIFTFWPVYIGGSTFQLKEIEDMMNTGMTHAGIVIRPTDNYAEQNIKILRDKGYKIAQEISAGHYSWGGTKELTSGVDDTKFLSAPCLNKNLCENWNSSYAIDPSYTGVLWQNTLDNTKNVSSRVQAEVVLFDTEIWSKPENIEWYFARGGDPGSDCKCEVIKEGMGFQMYLDAWRERISELKESAKAGSPKSEVYFYGSFTEDGYKWYPEYSGKTKIWDSPYIPYGIGDYPNPSFYYLPNMEVWEKNMQDLSMKDAVPWISFTYSSGYSEFMGANYYEFDSSVSREAGRMLRKAGARGFIVYPCVNPYKNDIKVYNQWLNHAQEMIEGFKEGDSYVEKNLIKNPSFEALKTKSDGYNSTSLRGDTRFIPVFWNWTDSNHSYTDGSKYANLTMDTKSGIYSWGHSRYGDSGARTIWSREFSVTSSESGEYYFSAWTKSSMNSQDGRIRFYVEKNGITTPITETYLSGEWSQSQGNVILDPGTYILKILIEDNTSQRVDVFFDDLSLEKKGGEKSQNRITFISPTPTTSQRLSQGRFTIKAQINSPTLQSLQLLWNSKSYPIMSQNTILKYNFDQNSQIGETPNTFKDITTKANHGTGINLEGDGSVQGKVNKAIQLDGVNDKIQIPHNPNQQITNHGTWNCWVKLNSYEGCQSFISKRDTHNTNAAWAMGINFGYPNVSKELTFEYNIDNKKNWAYGYDKTSIPLNQWAMLTFVYNSQDPRNVRFYVDGKEVNPILEEAQNAPLYNSNSPIYIGAVNNGSACYFNGSMDELVIMGEALSSEEIQILYESSLVKQDPSTWIFTLNKGETTPLPEGKYTYSLTTPDPSVNSESRILFVGAETTIPGSQETGGGETQGGQTGQGTVSDTKKGECSSGETNPCGSSIGECKQGVQSCVGGQWGECAGQVGPSQEVCDGLDNNCNGQVDENCLCVEGQSKPCGSNIGICEQGVQSCVGGKWGSCVGNTPPLSEDTCFNYLDDNCNGEVDEGCGEAFNTCNNGKLDEGEQGIDCGGKCPKKCPDFELISVLMVLVGLFGMIGTTVYFGYIK